MRRFYLDTSLLCCDLLNKHCLCLFVYWDVEILLFCLLESRRECFIFIFLNWKAPVIKALLTYWSVGCLIVDGIGTNLVKGAIRFV